MSSQLNPFKAHFNDQNSAFVILCKEFSPCDQIDFSNLMSSNNNKKLSMIRGNDDFIDYSENVQKSSKTYQFFNTCEILVTLLIPLQISKSPAMMVKYSTDRQMTDQGAVK